MLHVRSMLQLTARQRPTEPLVEQQHQNRRLPAFLRQPVCVLTRLGPPLHAGSQSRPRRCRDPGPITLSTGLPVARVQLHCVRLSGAQLPSDRHRARTLYVRPSPSRFPRKGDIVDSRDYLLVWPSVMPQLPCTGALRANSPQVVLHGPRRRGARPPPGALSQGAPGTLANVANL